MASVMNWKSAFHHGMQSWKWMSKKSIDKHDVVSTISNNYQFLTLTDSCFHLGSDAIFNEDRLRNHAIPSYSIFCDSIILH
jgi:hypothetical protein